MNPYYEEKGITIYHGDCREILPQIPRVDLVLTDPPYGVSYSPDDGGRGWTQGRKTFGGRTNRRLSGGNLVHGDNKDFDPSFLLSYSEVILWGANHYADKLPAKASWLVWDKRQIGLTNDFADCELAWWSKGGPARIFRHLWNGAFRESERGEERVHPTQKPIKLMKWCLGLSSSEAVLDPFIGSGTTLRAAKDLGRQAIGIEIEEKYCEIAANRLRQEVLDFEPLEITKNDYQFARDLFFSEPIVS